ncbi:MAG: OmpP1/FadL family transporter [Fusobacteriaceae bacterium]
MKKISIMAFLLISTMGKGASIDHIMNYTAEYSANPALQGVINYSSTVNFNPAGLMRLENGLYMNGGLQYATGGYEMNYKGRSYKSDLGSPAPNFSLYKKYDNYALFWTVGGIAGGAALNYKDGISAYGKIENQLSAFAKISDSSAKGSNVYIQSTLGTAFNINEKLSMSVAGRIVHGQRDFEGEVQVTSALLKNPTLSVDAEREAWGLGVQLGLNYAATEKLNLGLRYDSKVKMNFKTDSTVGAPLPIVGINFDALYPEYKDGMKARRDLPAILALGAQYKITPAWTGFLGGNYYFNKSANIDEEVQTKTGASRKYKDGYEFSLGSEYEINEKWSWLAGTNYAITGAEKDNYHDSEFALDSLMFGTGIKYKHNDTLELLGSVAHYFYNSSNSTDGDVEYIKETTVLGGGFTYKF